MVKKIARHVLSYREIMASGVWAGIFEGVLKTCFFVTILSILYIDAYVCD